MNLDQIVEEDKLSGVSAGFYIGIQNKMQIRTSIKDLDRLFIRKHLWMSLAAGVVLGLLISGITKFHFRYDRPEMLKEWVDNHYMDDIAMEKANDYFF